MSLLVPLGLFALAVALLYRGRALLAWLVPGAMLLSWWYLQAGSTALWTISTVMYGLLALVFAIAPVRRQLVTRSVMRIMTKILPDMSDTDRVALEAGTVWWDADLFSGDPDWKKLLDYETHGLSTREREFLDNEVETVCRMVDNEAIDKLGNLPPEVWEFLKRKGFMGLIIPQEYGGLGFSAEANSAVVTKVSSRSITLAVTVMVPNSLGPAELLLHYGTKEQKDYYLPRLANGEEIPAFALTEPGAGSDAGAMTSSGVVCKGHWKGEEVVGIRLNWNKRYITLAPVATLLGLAFKLYDPDGLIGDKEDLGITCALIPQDIPGVETGRRHDPLGIKFLNGPTTGQDVFVPLDFIIGGAEMAGQGWRMLMDCLSAGRSISLPGLAVGGAQVTSRALSAYCVLREQFNTPIGRFEGIEERLGNVSGMTWMMNAARHVTAGAVANGHKPSVISAIVKCWLTEGMREVVNDGMDIQGGAAICCGPRNVLARPYQGLPIGITVEGANILTRTLIVYGQGALRCHPYAFAEMEAVRKSDLEAFDQAFFSHVGYVFSTASRALVTSLGLTRFKPTLMSGPAGQGLRDLSRLSAAFALCSEAAMATLGGELKRKERITGRLADALAWMYLGSAAVKRWKDDGERESDRPFLQWSLQRSCHEIQEALFGVLQNLPSRPVAWVLRLLAFPLGRTFQPPSDRVSGRCARALIEDDDVRDRLTADIFRPEQSEPGLGSLDHAREAIVAVAELRKRLKRAVRDGVLPRQAESTLLDAAVKAGVIDDRERASLERAYALQHDQIQVDSYDAGGYLTRCGA